MGSVVDGGENIFALEKRIVFEDFLEGSACAKQLEHIFDADPLVLLC